MPRAGGAPINLMRGQVTVRPQLMTGRASRGEHRRKLPHTKMQCRRLVQWWFAMQPCYSPNYSGACHAPDARSARSGITSRHEPPSDAPGGIPLASTGRVAYWAIYRMYQSGSWHRISSQPVQVLTRLQAKRLRTHSRKKPRYAGLMSISDPVARIFRLANPATIRC